MPTTNPQFPLIEIPILLVFIAITLVVAGWFIVTLIRQRRATFEDETFKQFIGVMAAIVAVLAANVTYLQTDAGAISDRFGREGQRFIIQAMGLKTSGEAEIGYGLYTAQIWYELGKLSGTARQAGDGAEANRYKAAQAGIAPLSPLLSPSYNLDIHKYEADVYVRSAATLVEQFAISSRLGDAWGAKGRDYVTQIALLAVVLFLFGLSTTIAGRVRLLFFATGSAIFLVTCGWMLAVMAQPISAITPQSVDQYARGVGLAHQGNYKDAADAFSQAIAQTPEAAYANAYYERANARTALGDYQAAVDDYKAAQDAGRDDSAVALNLGWAAYLAGQFDDAIQASRHALDLDPGQLGARTNLGLALLASGQADAARREYAAVMQQAAQAVAEARANGQDLPYEFWSQLDTGARDLASLLDRLANHTRPWTQAPARDALAKAGDASAAQDLFAQLRSLAVALEYTGKPPAGNLAARITPLQFAPPYGRGGGGGGGAEPRTPFEAGTPIDFDRKIYFPVASASSIMITSEFPLEGITDTFAYGSDIVLAAFDFSGMRDGQSIVWRGYVNGQEDLSLRRVMTWTLGASGNAQRSIDFVFGGAGEYTMELYVDGRLAQRGSFTILPKGPRDLFAYDEVKPSAADNSLDLTGGQLQRIGKGVITGATFAPDGRRFAVATSLGVYLHDTQTLSQVGFLPTGEPAGALAYSPDGKLVAISGGTPAGAITVRDAASGETLHALAGHADSVTSVAFSPDGKRLASASADTPAGAIKLWDVASGNLLNTLEEQADTVNQVVFSPDGALLASAGADSLIKLWDVAARTDARAPGVVATLEGHTSTVNMVAFSPDGTTLASASADKTIKLWDVGSATLLGTLTGHAGAVNSVAFSPDGRKLVSASADHSIKVWDAGNGKLLLTRAYHQDNVIGAEFSPDGALLLSVSWDNTIQEYKADSGDWIQTLHGYPDYLNAVAVSPDGALVAAASRDKRARVWDTKTGDMANVFVGHTSYVNAIAYSPDGARIATGSADNSVRLWSAGAGESLHELQGHTDVVYGVAFSPDGLRVASASADETARLWSADTGELLSTLEGHADAVTCVAFEPPLKPGEYRSPYVATGSADKTIRIWDVDGRSVMTLTGHADTVLGVAFSPDGAQLVSAARDGSVKLWNVESGKLARDLAQVDSIVNGVAFSPDGRLVAAGAADWRVLVWDAATGKLVHTFEGHAGSVNSVAFTPDGRRLVSASNDGTVRFWDVK